MLKAMAKKTLQRVGVRREQAAALRMLWERNALSVLQPKVRKRPGGRILAYHSVGQPRTGVNDVAPEIFARQLDLARELGHRFVPARQIANGDSDPMDLAITFDDAWTSAAVHAAPILRQRDIPWTLFVVSDWSDHQSEWTQKDILGWEALKALSAGDVELGSHSKSHPDFARLSEADIEAELRTSREVMHQRLGVAPATFAIPFGQSMNWNEMAHELARAAGYEVVYSQAENTRFPGTAPRTFVTKFDNDRIFRALLDGAFDDWEEWV